MKALEPTPDQASLATESAAALVDSAQGGVVGRGRWLRQRLRTH